MQVDIFLNSRMENPFIVKLAIFCNCKLGTVSLVENDEKAGSISHSSYLQLQGKVHFCITWKGFFPSSRQDQSIGLCS